MVRRGFVALWVYMRNIWYVHTLPNRICMPLVKTSEALFTKLINNTVHFLFCLCTRAVLTNPTQIFANALARPTSTKTWLPLHKMQA